MPTIFITGCSSGIGLISAFALKERGYRVITSCRKDSDRQSLIEQGFETVLLDLDDPNSVNQAAHEVLTLTEGKLDALFNNAGFGVYGKLNSISRQDLEKQFATNFFGIHQLTLLLLPAMLKQNKGRIIQMSSIVGIIATPGRGAYSASKYALEAWSDALRIELANTNIKISLIEPGPLKTKFSANVKQKDEQHKVVNAPLVQRFALEPEAILAPLIHALENSKPKIRYRVTKVTHMAALVKRLLPDRLMDKILKNK